MLGLISIRTGLLMVRVALKKTIKQEVENFDIIYRREKNVIDFRLYDYVDEDKVFHKTLVVKYPDGKKLCALFEMEIKKHFDDEKFIIKYAVLNFKSNKCEVYMTDKKTGDNINKTIEI